MHSERRRRATPPLRVRAAGALHYLTMETLLPLASALGLGMLAGLRLYATVLAVGLLLRFDWINLPASWQHASVLADTRVLIVAAVACVIEFIADKIPWVDSAWDSVHTFIRPIGAALLTSSLFSNLDPVYKVVLFLLAGGVALSGHSAKAATRLAVNHSPEPFSNVAVSLGEDTFVAGGLYMLVKHPWIMAGITLVLLSLFAWLTPRIYRALRAEWKTFGALLRSWFGEVREPQLTTAQERWLREHCSTEAPRRLFSVIATADLKGLRNAVGTLCVNGREAVFFCRKWGRLVARQIGPLDAIEIRRGFLVDELVLGASDGLRKRFDLLAGQLESAREVAKRLAPSTPISLIPGGHQRPAVDGRMKTGRPLRHGAIIPIAHAIPWLTACPAGRIAREVARRRLAPSARSHRCLTARPGSLPHDPRLHRRRRLRARRHHRRHPRGQRRGRAHVWVLW